MASVKYTGVLPPSLWGRTATTVRVATNSGKTVRVNTHRRAANATAPALIKIIRVLAKPPWDDIPLGTKADWKDPFGPAAWTRGGALDGDRHGWRHFVEAHFDNLFHRGTYYASSPLLMPNAIAAFSIQSPQWEDGTAHVHFTVHWYVPPTDADCLYVYQVNPRRQSNVHWRRWTRLVAQYHDWHYPRTTYELATPFLFRVDSEQTLRLWCRFRSAGGHINGPDASETRP